jgi:hypothetical protein
MFRTLIEVSAAVHDIIGGFIFLGVAVFFYFLFPIGDRLYPKARQNRPDLWRVLRILLPSFAALCSLYAVILAIVKR